MTVKIEIICTGYELLIGKVLNTNAQWLGKQITSLGAKVDRITIVPDEVEEIAKVIREVMSRRPRFIITTGGLGPTFDDKTLEGLAKAVDSDLVINNEALEILKQKYAEYARRKGLKDFELTPSRIKMVKIPSISKPLPNPVGVAPGVLTEVNDVSIITLPGVPEEMEAIFKNSITTLLRQEVGGEEYFERSIYPDNVMESTLDPLINIVMRDFPQVYIKSHPKREKGKHHIELHLSIHGKSSDNLENILQKAVDRLASLIREIGGTIFYEDKPEDHRC